MFLGQDFVEEFDNLVLLVIGELVEARKSQIFEAGTTARDKQQAEIGKARYRVDEAQVNGHAAVRMAGGLGFGLPMWEAVREAASLRWPATRFSARAWECASSNKIYAVQSMCPRRDDDPVDAVVAQMRCHEEGDLA